MKNKLAAVALTAGLIGGAGAGVVLGITQLSSAQTTTTPVTPTPAAATAPAADTGAAPSGSNEDATHEAGESAQREADEASGKAETGRILTTSLEHGALDPNDKAHLAKLISARTGLAPSDAEKRIDETFTRAKAEAAKAKAAAEQAADAARKAAAYSALWTFVALLCGAFAASYAATWGGRRRDHVTGY